MIFRSTNPEGHVHFGGDVMSGANCTRGVLLSSNSIRPVSDNTNEDLHLHGKGTGKVYLGGSTVPSQYVGGLSTATPPPLAANAQGVCTFAAAGISTGDLVLAVDFRGNLSTNYVVSQARCTAANEIVVDMANVHASTISASTSISVRWLYLDIT